MLVWSQRLRSEGSAAARQMGGHRPMVVAGEWADRGVVVSYDAVGRFYRRERMSFNKSLFAVDQDRPTVACMRVRLKRYQARLDPRRPVFIDDIRAKTTMTRRHGLAM